MLTRTPEQVALSEASRLSREIVHLSTDAAEQANDSGVKLLMSRVAEVHRNMLVGIERRIRATGDLPRGTDPELETVKELATRAKKVFASDADTILLDERIEGEQALLACLAEALSSPDLPPETRSSLEEARGGAREVLRMLHDERELRERRA
jgi:hypothetical protein